MILNTKAIDVENKWVPELSQTNDKLAMVVASVQSLWDNMGVDYPHNMGVDYPLDSAGIAGKNKMKASTVSWS